MLKKSFIAIVSIFCFLFSTNEFRANENIDKTIENDIPITINNDTIKKVKNTKKIIFDNTDYTSKKSTTILDCSELKKDIKKTLSWSITNNKDVILFINEIPYSIKNSDRFNNEINFKNLVIESFKEWQIKSKNIFDFRITYNQDKANVIVNWFNYFKNSVDYSYSNKLTYYSDINKKISYLNIPLSLKKYTSFKATDENIFYSKEELSIVIKHEIGHVLGLEDSSGIMSNIHNSNFLPSNITISNENISKLNEVFKTPTQSYLCNNSIKNLSDFRQNDKLNYLCYAPSKQILNSDGISFIRNYARWDKSKFPLKVFINLPSKKEHRIEDPNYYKEMVINSLKKWSDATSLVSFITYGEEKDSDIVVKWSDFFNHKNYWGTCQTITDPKNPNKKVKCIVNLAVRSQPYWYREKDELFNENTLKSIIIHEFGHTLGLDHGPDINGATGRGTIISQRDINSLKELYSIPINNNLLCNL